MVALHAICGYDVEDLFNFWKKLSDYVKDMPLFVI